MASATDKAPGYGLDRMHRLAFLVAGFGLPGVSDSHEKLEGEGDWRNLLSAIGYQRLSGLAIEAAESGCLDLTEEQWRDLVDAQRRRMCGALRIEGALVNLHDAFHQAGLEYVVLKGPSIAHCAYEDPSLRPFGDLDLLVRTTDWDAASEILGAAGFERAHPEAREGFHASFGKALVHTRGDGVEVDLHRRLVVGPHGLCADPAELFSGVQTFEVGGRALPRLADTWLFLHVCMHAALGTKSPLLLALRDVLEVARMPGVDWSLVENRANSWKLRAVVPYAVRAASDLLGAPAPETCDRVAVQLSPSGKERKWLEAYTTDRRGRGGTAVAAISAIPGFRDKVRYVTALLFPKRDFLENRQARRGSYLRRLAVPLNWLVGRRRP